MAPSAQHRPDPLAPLLSGRAAKRRLAALVLGLGAVYVAVWVLRPVSEDAVSEWVAPAGALAPAAYVAVAVALGLALVPGPLLAGGAGLLFGTLTGTAVALTAATMTAVIALEAARRVGRPGMEALQSRQVEVVSAALERHGLWAVVVQRLAPAVPDAPCSYAAGLLRVRHSHIALGTLLGAAPRAFGYTALGDSLDEPGSWQSLAGLAAVVLTAALGAYLARRIFVEVRRERRSSESQARRGPRTPRTLQRSSSGGSARGPSG